MRLPKLIEVSVAKFDPSQMLGEFVTSPIELYKIRCYAFAKDDYYYFLAPAEWTDREAMLYQFAK